MVIISHQAIIILNIKMGVKVEIFNLKKDGPKYFCWLKYKEEEALVLTSPSPHPFPEQIPVKNPANIPVNIPVNMPTPAADDPGLILFSLRTAICYLFVTFTPGPAATFSCYLSLPFTTSVHTFLYKNL